MNFENVDDDDGGLDSETFKSLYQKARVSA